VAIAVEFAGGEVRGFAIEVDDERRERMSAAELDAC